MLALDAGGCACRYVAWVTAAFGPFWGFQEGWWSWLSGVTDNSVYPVLFLSYLDAVVPGAPCSLRCRQVVDFGVREQVQLISNVAVACLTAGHDSTRVEFTYQDISGSHKTPYLQVFVELKLINNSGISVRATNGRNLLLGKNASLWHINVMPHQKTLT